MRRTFERTRATEGARRQGQGPGRRLDVWFERAAQWSFRRRVEPLWSFHP